MIARWMRLMLVLPLGVASVTRAAEAVPAEVRGLLSRHCAGCHGGDRPQQELRLEFSAQAAPAALDQLEVLDAIAARLRSRTMPPPEEAEPLGDADRRLLLQWIEGRIDQAVGQQANPGRVAIRRLTRVEYRNTIRDLLGLEANTSQFPSDDAAHGFNNLAEVITLPPLLMERYADEAERLAAQWREKTVRTLGVPPDLESLLALQQRAFRRPVSPAERQELLAFHQQCRSNGFSDAEVLPACLMKILLSPRFLYRIERDGPIGQDYRLDDFEIASRLSYFLWSSMPDDELFALARRGELQQEGQLEQQIHRMLQAPKIRTGLVENFAGQWLQTERLRAIRPDPDLFPDFDEPLREALEEETLRLFEAVVREDRPLTELLDADYTFVNDRLARHYGLAAGEGDAWRRVDLSHTPRRGVLTHGGILAINSHPTRTSPVLRGKWIMDVILGAPPPPPPADVAELEAVRVSGTLRQRLEAHRADPRCAACHQRMDALGLGLENFDAIGRWRTQDEGAAIDASGELAAGQTFDGPRQLIDLLRREHLADFRARLAERLLTYALGRTLGLYDRRPLQNIVLRTEASGDRCTALIQAIVASDAFRMRRNPGRIGVEGLPDGLLYDLSGNPDQQAILTLRPDPAADGPAETAPPEIELHSLQPLLGAATSSGTPLAFQQQPAPSERAAHRYRLQVPLQEPVHLTFLEGLLGPADSSDDFLKPIASFEPTDEPQVVQVAKSSHAWNGPLRGPDGVRPGSVLSFDAEIRLVAKPSDQVALFLATPGGTNDSMIENSGEFQLEGEGRHRVTQVGRRRAAMHDAWNDVLTLVIRTRTQTVVERISPIRVVRPQVAVSASDPIRLSAPRGQSLDSAPIRIWNPQATTLTGHSGQRWATILYGLCRLSADPKKPYQVTTEHVGVELTGQDAKLFELTGQSVVEDGRGVKLLGADGRPGLEGGETPESETFGVRFRGANQPGRYQATLRIVTQAGNAGRESSGEAGQPPRGLYFLEIPVTADVR